MADGSVIITVDADTKRAQSELARLEKGLQKTAAAMEKTGSERNGITEQLEVAQAKAEETRATIAKLNAQLAQTGRDLSGYGVDMSPDDMDAAKQVQQELTREIAQQSKTLAQQEKAVSGLEAKQTALTTKLQQQTLEYEKQQEAVGNMRSQLMQSGGQAMDRMKAGAANVTKSFNAGFKTILKYAFGIRSVYFLFRKLRAALKEGLLDYAKKDPETQANIDSLKASLNGLKLAWGSAFAPVVNAVIPILVKLIDWLTAAANAIAQFFAVLSGKGSYKKIVKNMDTVAGAAGGAGSAAEEAKKQILGFDEINRLDDNKSGGGGGGGGGGGLGDVIEEQIDKESFPAKLAFAVKDVLFDWSDLTPEQIAEKCLAGLLALGGAIVGGMIGGVPGAIIGALAGLALGILLDATIFNFDGELSKEEFFKALAVAVGAVGGGVIGFMIGGPLGAAIGMTLGLLIAFGAIQINWESLKKKLGGWWKEVKDYFQQYIDKWRESASEDAQSVGFDIVMGILEGILRGMFNILVWIGEHIVRPIVNGICELFGISSPSTVMAEIGGYLIDGLLQGIEESWNEILQWFQDAWNNLRSWWESLSLGSFHIPHPVFSWTYEEAGGLIARAMEFVGIPPMIPHLNIAWMARGGIVNGATLFGAGEAGREAIIPLERNTGWIKKVATELLDAMESQFSGALSGMPAMAMGGIAPPRAVGNSGSMFSDGDIERLVNGFAAALGVGGGDQTIQLVVDGRKMAEVVTKHQNEMARGYGR